MRCPNCETPNDDGASICSQCGEPLTPYAGRLHADANPARTAARIAEATRRPAIVPVMAAVDVLVAAGLLLMAVRIASATPQLSEDMVNYIGHAIGGLRTVLLLAFIIPLACLCLVLAWGTISQWSWAWTVHVVVLAVAGLRGLWLLPRSPVAGVAGLAVVAALGALWLAPDARRWYGRD